MDYRRAYIRLAVVLALCIGGLRGGGFGGNPGPDSRVLYAPQLAIGFEGDVEIVTTVTILNMSETDTNTALLEFFDREGEPQTLLVQNLVSFSPFLSGGTDPSWSFTSAYGGGSFVVVSQLEDAAEGLHTGWMRITIPDKAFFQVVGEGDGDQNVGVSVGYQIRDRATKDVLAAVDTQVGAGRTEHLVTLWEAPGEPLVSIGVALCNPHDEPVEVEVEAQQSGNRIATTTLQLNPGEQMAKFVPEIFAGNVEWEAQLDQAGSFIGALVVRSPLPVPLTALRGDSSERGFVLSNWQSFPGRK